MLVIILVIASLGLLSWWRLCRPIPLILKKRYRLARLTSSFHYRRALEAGILWDDDQGFIHANRWDGTPLWIMNMREMDKEDVQIIIRQSIISPDLHTVALLGWRNRYSGPCLRIWHDGRFRGFISLPPLPEDTCDGGFISMIDNARGIWYISAKQLLRIEDTRVIARKTLPRTHNEDVFKISPDGKYLIAFTETGWTYYSIKITGSTIHLYLAYTTRLPLSSDDRQITLLPRGMIISDNGTCFDRRGKIACPDGWQYVQISDEKSLTLPDSVVQSSNAKSRILTPKTGKYWILPEINADIRGITPDGRYALTVRYSSPNNKNVLISLVNRFSDRSLGRRTFSIYERPGRLRARATSSYNFTDHLPGTQLSPVELFTEDFIFSSNGRTLHIIAPCKNGKETYLELFNYHW